MSATATASAPAPSVVTALSPIMVAVLVGFLMIGAALPVLPLHVRGDLGFGPVMVGHLFDRAEYKQRNIIKRSA